MVENGELGDGSDVEFVHRVLISQINSNHADASSQSGSFVVVGLADCLSRLGL